MQNMPCILIVDDDPEISLLLSECLVELGHKTLGPVHSVSAALELLDACQPDARSVGVAS
jgi:CheY-like chemotaxis protein